MHRLLALAVMFAATSLAAPSTAEADGFYFTESFGGSHIKDELGQYMDSSFRLRLSAGMRRGHWAVDAWFATDIGGTDQPETGYYATHFLDTYGLDLRYIQPIADHLEIYLRGSMSHGSLYLEDSVDSDYGGRGLGFGGGIQLKGKVRALGFLAWPLFFTKIGPKVTASLFLDNGYDFYRLHRGNDFDAPAIDAQLTHMTLGFSVGSDF
ncbi:MAG TPA: hypothetical protein VFQ53_41790 [Kofleriaceae bacterium]|nr:hypothetical protein [Kofleriaceae bacterium]